MSQQFDKQYWEQHWQQDQAGGPVSMATNPPSPHLVREVAGLVPGTALDAGCGAGAEAIWLASQGWQVTAVDISAEALARAASRAKESGTSDGVQWLEADLSAWRPDKQFDLVATHYAHPAIPQLDFYDRLTGWVAPGGTLLIVGHLHAHDAEGDSGHGHAHGRGDGPPAEASVTAAAVVERLDDAQWQVETAEEVHRTLPSHGGTALTLQDVVVRATRRS